MAPRAAHLAALLLAGGLRAAAGAITLASYDVEYYANGAWTSATTAGAKYLKQGDTLRLVVVKSGAPYNEDVTLDPTKVRLTPDASGDSPGAASTFGLTFASTNASIASGAGRDTATWAITATGAYAGVFTVSLQSGAVTDTDGASSALATNTGKVTVGWVADVRVYTSTGATTTPTASVAPGTTLYLRVIYASGKISTATTTFVGTGSSGAALDCSGASDLTIDPTKVVFTDAGGSSYRASQVGVTVTSTCTGAGTGGNALAYASFALYVENWRTGGTYAVSLLDGAVSDVDGAYKSVAFAAVAGTSGLQISPATSMALTYDIGTYVAGTSTFTSLLSGAGARYALTTDTLYLKVSKTDGSTFAGTPALKSDHFALSGAVTGASIGSAIFAAAAPAYNDGASKTYYYALTLSTPAALDVYAVTALMGAIYDRSGSTYYASASATVASSFAVAWAPTLDVVSGGGSSVTGATVNAAGSYSLTVAYPSLSSTLATDLAVTCDASKFILKSGGVTYATAATGVAGQYAAAGITVTGGTAAPGAGTRVAAIVLTVNATAYGGVYTVDLADGACYVGAAGRKSAATTTNGITSFKTQAAVVVQLLSVDAATGNVTEVLADTSSAALATSSRLVGLGESVKVRLFKYGPTWSGALTVDASASKFAVTGGAATKPAVTVGHTTTTTCTIVAASGASPGYTYCDFPLTLAGTAAPTTAASWTLTLASGVITDGTSVTTAAPARALVFAVGWTPTFMLTAGTSDAPVDASTTTWAPGDGGIYLAASIGSTLLPGGTPTTFSGAAATWYMDWANVTLRDSTGAAVSRGYSGVSLPSAAAAAAYKSSDSAYLFFGPFSIASSSPRVDTYSLDFPQGTIYTSGGGTPVKSAQSLSRLGGGYTGIKVGFAVSAVLVRGDKTTSLSNVFLDRHDTDVYLKLTASGITNLGACSGIAADTTKFTFLAGNVTTKAVGVASSPSGCVDNSPDAYFRLDLTGVTPTNSYGAYVMSVAAGALSTGTSAGTVNFASTAVITLSSKAMQLGYPVTYSILDAEGNDFSSTGRQLAPGTTYFLRVARDDGGAFSTVPTIDVTKLSIAIGGVTTSDITVTSSGARTGQIGGGIIDLPLTVSRSAAPGSYVFSVQAGFLTQASVSTGAWPACLTQKVGLRITADMVDANGNTIEGRTVDVSSSVQRTFYIRLWRTVGTFATSGVNVPVVNTGSSSGCYGSWGAYAASAPCITVTRVDAFAASSPTPTPTASRTGSVSPPSTSSPSSSIAASGTPSNSLAPATTNSGTGTPMSTATSTRTSSQTPTATGTPLVNTFNVDFTVYRSSATYVDFKVTLISTVPAGLYVVDFGEGVIVDPSSGTGVRSGAYQSALSFALGYKLAVPGSLNVNDGAGGSLVSTWLGPASTAYLRIAAATASAAGYSADAKFYGADNSLTIDPAKVVFRDANGVAVTSFGFTGDNKFTHNTAYVDVGLDLAAVPPGVFTVTLLPGAVEDANGVTSLGLASTVATIKVGFGLTVDWWKTDATAPTYKVKTGEWVSGRVGVMYALRLAPDAVARSHNVLLNNNTWNNAVPKQLNADATKGLFRAPGAAPAWSAQLAAATDVLQTADTASFAWADNQPYATAAPTSAAGRDAYWYKVQPSASLAPSASYTGTISNGVVWDASGTIANYDVTLDASAFKVGFDVTPSVSLTASAAGAVGVYTPYQAGFSTAPVPFNTYRTVASSSTLALVLSYGSLSASYASSSPTTSIFESFPLSSTTLTSTATGSGPVTALTYTISSLLADQRAPGVYDITVPQGVLGDSGAGAAQLKNAELRMRLIVGMPAVVYDPTGTTPAALRSANQSTLVYVTNQRSVVVRQYVGVATDAGAATSTAVAFDSLYNRVYRNGDDSLVIPASGSSFYPFEVTDLIGGIASGNTILTGATLADGSTDLASQSVSAPYYALYRLDIGGLSDGTDYYRFVRRMDSAGGPHKGFSDKASGGVSEWAFPNLALIVDRTPPVGASVRFTGGVPYIGTVGAVTLPTTLFSDTVSSSPSQIRIVGVAAEDMHGFALVPGPQGVAQLVAASPVIGPAGDVVFTVTGADEAGNTATARLTVTLASKPKPVLTIADSRQLFTSGSLKTGVAQVASGVLAITAIATFPEPVSVLGASNLTVTQPNGTVVVAFTGAPSSSANGRVWTYRVAIPSVFAGAGYDSSVWQLQLAEDAGVAAAKGYRTAASNVAKVIIDSSVPTSLNGTVFASFTAVKGLPYFAPLPVSLFLDSVGGASKANPWATVEDNLDVVSGTADVNIGLTLTAGKLGAAYISGTATSKPVNGYVDFTVSARDEAGNTGTVVYRVLIETSAAATVGYGNANGASSPTLPTLAFDTSTASFADSGDATTPSAVTLSSSASWSSVDASTNTEVPIGAVYVYLATLDRDISGTPAETVAGTAPGSQTLTRMSYFGNNLIDAEVLGSAADTSVSVADVTSYLRSLAYANTNKAPTTGRRRVHVVVTRGQYVVGYASKTITVTSRNAVPAVSGVSNTATYYEANGRGVRVAPSVAVTDDDDTKMTKATFQIKTTDASTYGACDSARDFLYLRGDYMAPASPKVEASWDATTCTLTLAPVSGLSSLTIAEFQSAMRNVRYRNLDARDPTNGYVASGPAASRSIQIRVTDGASNGLTSATQTSLEGSYSYVTIATVDDAPAIDIDKAYAEGGMLYSTDDNSNWKVVVIGGKKYRLRKFSIAIDGTSTTATSYFLSLNLAKADDRYFGGESASSAAIHDADSKEPLASSAASTIVIAPTLVPSYVSVATSLASAGVDGVDYYQPYWTAHHRMSRIEFVVSNPSAVTGGEMRLRLTYGAGGPSVDFWVDVRVKGCTLRANGGAAVDLTRVYPDQAQCSALMASDPVLVQAVNVSAGAVATTADYTTLSSAVNAKAEALLQAGTALSDAINAAAAERAAARGVYKVTVPPSSFSTTDGTIAFSALPMDATARSLVPATAPGESVDTDVSIKLGPACQTFSKPVQVCIHVGDTDVGAATRNLRFASQFDCSDPSKGYGAFVPATEQSFNPISGELCGHTSHFSLAAVVTTTIAGTPTIPKTVNMGGSCPNDCSGKGYCRAEGKCVCFQGYTGYDCASRACPIAQSWDTSSSVVHKQVACGNRGICDAASGKCQCFDGYTGSACERAACPGGCSGHGRCLLLGELADVQASGYTSWEQTRYQVCACDGGYTGPDCSLRTCPFGDDPETACAASKKQVQRVSIDFGTMPTSLSSSLTTGGVYDVDEVVLVYTGADGANYTTNAIRNVFDPATAATGGVANMRSALVSLPNFAIDSVTVSADAVASSSTKAVYHVTFDAPPTVGASSATRPRRQVSGNRVPGNHALLSCLANIDGSMGCTTPGCRPLYKQARLYQYEANGGGGATLNAASLVSQPAALTSVAAGDSSTPGAWGVEVQLSIVKPADYPAKPVTYSVASYIYGTAGGASVASTPIPPGALRMVVPLVYGLTVDFDDDDANLVTTTSPIKFKWRLPTCTVDQEQAADVEFESAECANRGVCNRGTGSCTCHAGYAGYSCSQQSMIV